MIGQFHDLPFVAAGPHRPNALRSQLYTESKAGDGCRNSHATTTCEAMIPQHIHSRTCIDKETHHLENRCCSAMCSSAIVVSVVAQLFGEPLGLRLWLRSRPSAWRKIAPVVELLGQSGSSGRGSASSLFNLDITTASGSRTT